MLRLGFGFGVFAIVLFLIGALCEAVWPYNESAGQKAYTATMFLVALQQVWDFFVGSFNIAASVVQPMIPLWNAFVQYSCQPVFFITIEIISLVLPPFGNPDVFFALTDEASNERGFDCYATLREWEGHGGDAITNEMELLQIDPSDYSREQRAFSSMAWCGMIGWYQQGMTAVLDGRRLAEELSTEHDLGTERMVLHPHRMAQARELRERSRDAVPLPLDMVERVTRIRLRSLQLLTGDDFKKFSTEEGKIFEEITRVVRMSVSDMAKVISTVSGVGIFLLGSVADLIFHVIYVIRDDIITALGHGISMTVNILAQLVLSLFQSGAINLLLKLALDIITIMLLDISLPLFMLLINSLQCWFHLFNTQAWDAELTCIDEHCFREGGPSDMIVFFDAFPIIDFFYTIISDTFSAGSRLFAGGAYHLPPLTGWQRHEKTLINATTGCSQCFTCKVPELRLVNYVIMTVLSCYSPSQINTYSYNVLHHCKPNGSFYYDLFYDNLNGKQTVPDARGAFDASPIAT